MTNRSILLALPTALLCAFAIAPAQQAPAPPNDGKLRIIVFGAHPDDAEYRGAGVAMKWAKAGHHVKLVATTNGDIGHGNRRAVRWPCGG